MFELTIQSAPAYLAGRRIEALHVRELGGGISNTVLLAETSGPGIVLKQALPQLRVEQPWFSDRRRNLREAGAMRALAPHLPPGAMPEIFFSDHANCIYAMAAAPPDALDWKSRLLGGDISPATARQAGAILAAIIRTSWNNPAFEAPFGDQTVFDELRLDPYYRFTARRHPDLAGYFAERIQHCRTRRASLVHGDWSPKNLLVAGGGQVMAIDFEVVHFGDPSFDVAFLLNHLLLKMFYRPEDRGLLASAALEFWKTVSASVTAVWLEESVIRHLGCLLLARIDGKSPAEYIRTEALRAKIRARAKQLLLQPPGSIGEVFE